MERQARSLRPFIGSKDFAQSRAFYVDLGFQETVITATMSLFRAAAIGFYLQDFYNEEWLDNTMIFMEVADVQGHWNELRALELPASYAGVRLSPVQPFDWGKECCLTDPAGVLWHFGEFAQ